MNDSKPESLEQLQETLGITFQNATLLQQAFIHRSYINEHRGLNLEHNERLEFLGDAVLELVVTEYLYLNYPNPEGELTNWRSALVKGETLSDIGNTLGFSNFLMVSKGEAKSGGRQKNALLANAFEALIGALYLDQGYEVCQDIIMRTVIVRLPVILEQKLYKDPKSSLQEFVQERFGCTPTYMLISEEGPDHAKVFLVGVLVNGQEVAQGTGSSKQAAQVAAAESALATLSTAS